MSSNVARFIHFAVLAVGLTGVIYGWMRYLVEPNFEEDEFAILNHPWEPDLRVLHILLAPVLVFGCVWIWKEHIWLRISTGFRNRRATGLTLALLLFPMIASGYLVQVSEAVLWRDIWIWTHGITSCLWLLCYALHQFKRS